MLSVITDIWRKSANKHTRRRIYCSFWALFIVQLWAAPLVARRWRLLRTRRARCRCDKRPAEIITTSALTLRQREFLRLLFHLTQRCYFSENFHRSSKTASSLCWDPVKICKDLECLAESGIAVPYPGQGRGITFFEISRKHK